jgi:hypothetical protein
MCMMQMKAQSLISMHKFFLDTRLYCCLHWRLVRTLGHRGSISGRLRLNPWALQPGHMPSYWIGLILVISSTAGHDDLTTNGDRTTTRHRTIGTINLDTQGQWSIKLMKCLVKIAACLNLNLLLPMKHNFVIFRTSWSILGWTDIATLFLGKWNGHTASLHRLVILFIFIFYYHHHYYYCCWAFKSYSSSLLSAELLE